MNSPKKKILIFSLAYHPFIGGAEIAVAEITKRLLARGDFSFDMLTLNLDGKQKENENIGGVDVHRLNGSKLVFPFAAFFAARRLHRNNNYDVTWAIMANRAGFAALFFKIFNPKVPFVLTLQEGDPLDYPEKRMGIFWLLLAPAFKMIFRRADKVTAISNFLAEWGRKMGAKNVEVVPNGVDLGRFKIKDSRFKNEDIRGEVGFSKDDVVLVTTSRLVPKNGIGDIAEALKFLPENFKLMVIGSGPLEKSLKLEVGSLKLGQRVKFMGNIPNENLPPYLWASNIFVRPSLSEGMGSSFVEAMAAGLPVIGTPVGGIPDFLKDGETGFFCEPDNPQSVAEKVKQLLTDDLLRKRIIQNARNLVVEKYEWERIAKTMGEYLTF